MVLWGVRYGVFARSVPGRVSASSSSSSFFFFFEIEVAGLALAMNMAYIDRID